VVLDLNMQVKDGRTTLREIKADPALASIPVVILSTSADQADIDYCKKNGAAAYYRKPGSILELVEILRALRKEYLN
jgi:CheY-like chemotaxis protein